MRRPAVFHRPLADPTATSGARCGVHLLVQGVRNLEGMVQSLLYPEFWIDSFLGFGTS